MSITSAGKALRITSEAVEVSRYAPLTAMHGALVHLFDYAGMFPPAAADLNAALSQYSSDQRGNCAWALNCMIVDCCTLERLRERSLFELRDLRLSVVANVVDLEIVQRELAGGLSIEAIDVKASDPDDLALLHRKLPARIMKYVEVSPDRLDSAMLDLLRRTGMRGKLRMGGVVSAAFPRASVVATTLKDFAERGIAFKATAGLHHPVRSEHPLTYELNSESALMHGFVNLLCAAACVWFGGGVDQAIQILEEQEPQAWNVKPEMIRWRSASWSANQLREVREQFLISIGSCSFIEPMRDLEGLGWL